MRSIARLARRRRQGLTLMEVLVAITLLSLLSAGMLMALRVAAGAWERTNTDLMLDRRIAAANAILHAALEGVVPAWVEFRRPTMASPTLALFFQGQPESMRFVSAYSLDSGPRGGLRLLELQVVRAEQGLRLLLNDQPHPGPAEAGRLIVGAVDDPLTRSLRLFFAPIVAQPSSFIVADELAGCAFSYLSTAAPNEPARWLPAWSRSDQWPAAISIQLAPRGDSARLRPVTVTVPFRSREGP